MSYSLSSVNGTGSYCNITTDLLDDCKPGEIVNMESTKQYMHSLVSYYDNDAKTMIVEYPGYQDYFDYPRTYSFQYTICKSPNTEGESSLLQFKESTREYKKSM